MVQCRNVPLGNLAYERRLSSDQGPFSRPFSVRADELTGGKVEQSNRKGAELLDKPSDREPDFETSAGFTLSLIIIDWFTLRPSARRILPWNISPLKSSARESANH